MVNTCSNDAARKSDLSLQSRVCEVSFCDEVTIVLAFALCARDSCLERESSNVEQWLGRNARRNVFTDVPKLFSDYLPNADWHRNNIVRPHSKQMQKMFVWKNKKIQFLSFNNDSDIFDSLTIAEKSLSIAIQNDHDVHFSCYQHEKWHDYSKITQTKKRVVVWILWYLMCDLCVSLVTEPF